MTNHITKTWFDGKTVVTVTKEIPVEEFYKREWVGLTFEEKQHAIYLSDWKTTYMEAVIEYLEAKLKEKNT